jgi:hypothetical protein
MTDTTKKTRAPRAMLTVDLGRDLLARLRALCVTLADRSVAELSGSRATPAAIIRAGTLAMVERMEATHRPARDAAG